MFNYSGISVDNSGNVYVADAGNDRIQKFTSSGNHILSIGEFGHDEGKFNLPRDVDLDSKGNIFVADTGNNRIQKITGQSIKVWLKSFDLPLSLAIDSSDNVYVTDTNNHKINRFDPNGKSGSSFGDFGFTLNKLNFPSSVAVDTSGNITVADKGNNQIKKFDVRITKIHNIDKLKTLLK